MCDSTALYTPPHYIQRVCGGDYENHEDDDEAGDYMQALTILKIYVVNSIFIIP